MTLVELASVFSIAESLVVAITLIAVLIQLRQTNRIARIAAYQELTSTWMQFVNEIACNEDLSRLFTTGRFVPDTLSDHERERFYLLCVEVFSFHENLFLLHQSGFVLDVYYKGWREDLRKDLVQPGFIQYWLAQGDEYAPVFQSYVNGFLIQNNAVAR